MARKATPLPPVKHSRRVVEKSTSTREIENGHVTTESCYGPNGYSSREYFHEGPNPSPDRGNSLREAVDELK